MFVNRLLAVIDVRNHFALHCFSDVFISVCKCLVIFEFLTDHCNIFEGV